MDILGEDVGYSTIMSGKLALKGGLKLAKEKKVKKAKKKKKSKKSKKRKSRDREADGAEVNGEHVDESRARKRSRSESSEDENAGLTPAQKKFMEVQQKREKDLIARMAEKTHRERINEFNERLAALSEHHDVPKVGNAGMG